MDYIDTMHPRVKLDDGTYDQEVEQTRHNLITNFAKPGGPGAKFKNIQEKLFKSLTLPKGAREELGITGEDGGINVEDSEEEAPENEEEEDPEKAAAREQRRYDRKMLNTLFGDGKYFLVPSFYRMIMYLKKTKQEFSVVFNSFGHELDPVVYEFNKFCTGEHPCFNGRNNTPLVKLDGSKNSKDFRIKDASQRVQMYRASDKLQDTIMVTGGNDRCESIAKVNMIEETDEVMVIRDHLEIFTSQLETLKKFGSLVVSEDY